jgi:hypothetical protein
MPRFRRGIYGSGWKLTHATQIIFHIRSPLMVRELFDQPGHYFLGLFFIVHIFIKNFGNTKIGLGNQRVFRVNFSKMNTGLGVYIFFAQKVQMGDL